MSEIQGTSSAERIARYKEVRRQQLESQFAPFREQQASSFQRKQRTPSYGKEGSSSNEEPRATRASRLRAAVCGVQEAPSLSSLKIEKEKSSGSSSGDHFNKTEKDKSNKRKSNLNRCLNSEETSNPDIAPDDAAARRRRRRFFPPEILQQTAKDANDGDSKSYNHTAHSSSTTSSGTATTFVAPASRTTPKKSELRMHMENARRGHLVSYSEMGKSKASPPKRTKERSPKLSSTTEVDSIHTLSENNNIAKLANKENFRGNIKNPIKQDKGRLTTSDNDQLAFKQCRPSNVSKRMDELTALTHETLARVERLTGKTRDSPKREVLRTSLFSVKSRPPCTHNEQDNRLDVKLENKADPRVPSICDSRKIYTHSILKKKSIDESFSDTVPTVVHSPPVSAPISILKRKVSQDEFRLQGGASSTITPPVTFSPSVIDPSTTRKRQGILKKRRSLDESQVLRHRSCSPEGALANRGDSRSILKTQRRSSLENIAHTQSPESGLQGILKRRTSRHEDETDPLTNSPELQGILKRRSGTSSAGSNVNSPHVSIATAVILAAAGGAEIVLESNESVKPILKKRSFSEDQPLGENFVEAPKPILKKKSSTDTEDSEERPKKPILKHSKNSFDERDWDGSAKNIYNKLNDDPLDCEVRPILKTSSRENSPRPRLSFCTNDEIPCTNLQKPSGLSRYLKNSRRAHTICTTDFNVNASLGRHQMENEVIEESKPISVSSIVLNIEKRLSTGAIPKKVNSKRHNERYKTQPVTYHELEASLSSVHNAFQQDRPPPPFPLCSPILPTNNDNNGGQNAHSLLDLTSFETENTINNLLSGLLLNTTFDSGISGKMSSDSAFQSLGDGLELEQDDKLYPQPSPSPHPQPTKPKMMDPARFQMKALAEEAKNLQLRKGDFTRRLKNRKATDCNEGSVSSRFSTQPITSNEVKEASKLKDDLVPDGLPDLSKDPSRLSLSERIKLFSKTFAQEPTIPKPRHRPFTRFQTQPITVEEVQSARAPLHNRPNNFALESLKDDSQLQAERKGILKSKSGSSPITTIGSPKFVDNLKSVLKKHELPPKAKESALKSLRSILKTETVEFARDEGISSDESGTNSDTDCDSKHANGSDKEDKMDGLSISARLSRIYGDRMGESKSSGEETPQTSDGDSSGGREVRSIIESALPGRRRIANKFENEGLILKSKSQSTVRDEDGIKMEVRRSMTHAAMPKSIAELQAKLQNSGDNEWRKRIPKLNSANEELSLLNVKNIYNEELSEKASILSARKDELDAASKQWRSRVEQSDALNFSVAGRMQQSNEIPRMPIHLPVPDKYKRTPKAKVFKGRDGGDIRIETTSTPSSPERGVVLGLKKSISLPGAGDNESSSLPASESSVQKASRRVQVERPDNITFTSFFESINSKRKSEMPDISVDDFDSILRRSEDLLVQKRTIKVQRKHEASRNPIKALAARTDIKNEYTEIITGVAEREKHRLNVEKLAKSSNFAVEALAGLASKEDFSSVALKRSSSLNSTFPPYQDLMLLQVKGRRFVQTRLVQPVASSINEGDNYVLVTPNTVFNYIGAYSNVIEQSRAADIVNSVQQTGDLGCKTDKIVTINSRKSGTCASSDVARFWKLLGSLRGAEIAAAGHPDEDEIYESSIIGTNMIYEYKDQHLLPVQTYWGSVPKIQMLSPVKIFVFDFGSEMYVWSGKNALLEDKKKALGLARELWSEGYNYTECAINPIEISSMLGSRTEKVLVLKDNVRPKWSLFAKITQHRETVLFKEKFLDWPDYSKVIKVKKQDDQEKNVEVKFDFKPCDINKMRMVNVSEPDLVIDGVHLGRGTTYFDDETNRLFTFSTRSVTCWVILEYTHEDISSESVGQFYDGNSYIVRWEYCANITGRELSGKPSKYAQAGRDHCVYFCWQGSNATINEKGAAALLTIKLDSENARQIRVLQGYESPAFLSLFGGAMVVHSGKCEKSNRGNSSKLYISQGEMQSETFLTEVPCSMRSLRSRSSFVLIQRKSRKVVVWNGCKTSSQCRKVAKDAAEKIIKNRPAEFDFIDYQISLDIVEEGLEDNEVLSALGGEKRQLYLTLMKNLLKFNYTPRLFHLSSLSGNFEAVEVLSPRRSEHIIPYPFLQSDLYSAGQPALFMLDNGHEVWLWQGWWPEREDDLTLIDQTGSGAVRWQEERKVAMQTVVKYCERENGEKRIPCYLVWAGLEPLVFTNLFSMWKDRDDIAESNMKEGKKPGEAIVVEKELALLTRSTYPLEQLLQRPLPDGVDPTHLENYLSLEDFSELMSMSLEEFQKLPSWKQIAVKKEKGLF